jgi:microcystin degradation protein MlrC
MIERGVQKVGVATIWDPIAVTFCLRRRGAVIDLRFGGKAGPEAGEPIDARVRVVRGGRGRLAELRAFAGHARPDSIGADRGYGNRCDPEYQPHANFRPDIFSNLGVDPASKDVLLIKSTNHFYAGFAPIAAEIIYVDAPTSYPSNPAKTRYTKLNRDIWPRVANPHALETA